MVYLQKLHVGRYSASATTDALKAAVKSTLCIVRTRTCVYYNNHVRRLRGKLSVLSSISILKLQYAVSVYFTAIAAFRYHLALASQTCLWTSVLKMLSLGPGPGFPSMHSADFGKRRKSNSDYRTI